MSEFRTQDLGHLGLVAGMCKELRIAEMVDKVMPPSDKQISHGTAVCAMILNGLGFINQRLYLMPEFFQNKPVDRLLGEGITADQLNDDTLGRTMDAIYDYNPTELYAHISAQSCVILGLHSRFGHMDSTGFHVDGKYNADQPPQEGIIRLTKGYSRDHRPDLNQCILNLIVESQASIPIHMSSASGNCEDKTEFRSLVKKHIEQLKNAIGFEYIVADSALYTEDTLKELADRALFITRMPETLSIAKDLLKRIDIEFMQKIDDKYRYQEVCGIYGQVKQRWIIVFSQHAYDREIQTLNRRMLKGGDQEYKDFVKLCNRPFACQEDAKRAWEKFQTTLQYTFVADLQIQEQARYGKRGKPKKGESPQSIDYFITGAISSSLEERAQQMRMKGLFILATNELDSDKLSAIDVLKNYKGQSKVEKGFRFLKNPEFIAGTLFLKKPERIMALLMIMTLCLMVYAALEYRIRQGLQQQGQTVINQVNKQTDRPTARWIFHCFTGIHILLSDGTCIGVLNLEEKHWQIINLLGYRDFYI